MQLSEEYYYYLTIVKRRYLYFLVPFVGCFLISVGIIFILKPIYRATATLLIESQKIPENFVQSTVGSLAEERLEVIGKKALTRDNLLRMINKFSLFSDKKDRLSLTEMIDEMRARTQIKQTPLFLGKKNTRRRNSPTTIAFTVAFEYENPTIAAKVTNELVTIILDVDVTTRRLRASETTRFLEREAKRLEQKLVTIENQIVEYKRKHKDALPKNLSHRLKMLENAQTELTLLDKQIINYFGDTSSQSEQSNSPSQKLNSLEAEYSRLSAIKTDHHPSMQLLRHQINALKKQNGNNFTSRINEQSKNRDALLTASVGEKPIGYAGAPVGLRAQRDVLAIKVIELKKLIDFTPEVERGINTLARDYEKTKQRYEDLISKQQQARLGERLEEDKQAESFDVIEHAVIPQEPIKPKRLLLIGISFLSAFALGGIIVFVIEFLDKSIRTSADLIKFTGVRPLASIPYIASPDEQYKKSRIIKLFAR